MSLWSSGQQRSHSATPHPYPNPLPPATILLITQTELLRAASGHSQDCGSSVCLRRLWKTGRSGEEKTKTSVSPIRKWAKFVFIRANRGKQPKWMANTHAHTAGSSLRACKHTPVIQQDGGKQACKRGHTQHTAACMKCMSGFSVVLLFFSLWKIKMHNHFKRSVLSCCW